MMTGCMLQKMRKSELYVIMDNASAEDNCLPNVLITIENLEALSTHLQELNGARAYHGSDWWSIPASEEPNGEAYAEKGYDTCLEDVMRYFKTLSTAS